MTPFMLRVAEIVGTPQDQLPELDELAPMPETRISRRIATGTGADRQVAIRSLAEQLVSEANAILGQADDRLQLVDEKLPHELDGPDALPDLIVRLLVESGVSHHHVP